MSREGAAGLHRHAHLNHILGGRGRAGEGVEEAAGVRTINSVVQRLVGAGACMGAGSCKGACMAVGSCQGVGTEVGYMPRRSSGADEAVEQGEGV